MKSVVVEINKKYAAVLSEDGSILKVKNKNYYVGQVILMKKTKIQVTKKLALAVASLGVVLLSSGIGAWAYTAPYSYVSLDVNPSIEYTLNRFERVIDVKAVNDDGQEILSEIDVKDLNNKSIEDAVLATVKEIMGEGYFTSQQPSTVTGSAIENSENAEENNAEEPQTEEPTEQPTEQTEETVADNVFSLEGGIVITVANGKTSVSEELTSQIRESVATLLNENGLEEEVEVEVLSVGYDRVQRAKELGVTPGKLNLVEKLQASVENPDSIVVEEWLNKPVKDIMKAIKQNVVEEAQEGEDQANETEQEAQTEEQEREAELKAEEQEKQAELKAEEVERETEQKAAEKAREAEQKDEEKAKDAQEKAEEKAKEAKEKAEEKAKEAKEKAKEAKEKAKEAKEKAKEAQEKAEEKAKEAQEKAEEKAKEAQEKAEEKAKEAQEKAEEKAREAQQKAAEKTREAEQKAAEQEREAKQKAAEQAREASQRNNASNGKGNN